MKISDIEVSYIQHCGDDISVVNAARVSFHKESEFERVAAPGIGYNDFKLKDADAKLIKYLAKHKHTSPFNHSFITLRVKAPIFVARQLVKHRFMPWNEVSRRYVDDEPEFWMPEKDDGYYKFRKSAANVKQGSSDETVDYHLTGVVEQSVFIYNDMLRAGIAPEMARMILPQNTMTEWMWSGTLGAYADMLRLRLDPHAQLESRIVAQKARDIIEPLFPVSLKALLESV